MARNAVGFYWTLPAPWVGFRRLPEAVDEAAKKSKTIRYQRDLIRRCAEEEGYLLVHEEVFLEIDPDRGSDLIFAALEKVKKICRAEDAVLFVVDFSEVSRWREHMVMTCWLREANIDIENISPREIILDGKIFDPHAHFRSWRQKHRDWTEKKPERIGRAVERAKELLELGKSFLEIAETLNTEKVQTPTGRPWKPDNIRSFMKNRTAS